jgi:HEAT repeat protein
MGRVDELIRELETGNTNERIQAAELLGQLGDLNAVPELLNAYETRKGFLDVPIIEAVGEILGRTTPDDDESREVFSNAVNWLIEIAQERDFRSRDFQTLCQMRVAAAKALAKTRDPKAIPALTKQLHDDLCFDDARAAAVALRHFNDPQAIQALIQTAGNKNIAESIRQAAVESLSELGDPKAVDTFIQIVEDQSVYYQIRRAAARALGRIGDPKAIEPLIRTLERERESVTSDVAAEIADILGEDIAKALGAFRDPRVVDALIKALGYEFHTAHGASESLKKLRDKRAVEPLIRIVEDDGNRNKGLGYDYGRAFAAGILGVLGDPRAIPTLAKALRDDDIKVREYAFESLRAFVLTHPDAILRLPPDDRHLLGRLIQDAQRDELSQEICK